jgi:hypothetical protein
VRLRYFVDPETGEPHIWNHAVSEDEVEAILRAPGEDRRGSNDSRAAIGRTPSGRYLRVIYVRDPAPESFFIDCLRASRQTAYGIHSAQAKEEAIMPKNEFPPGWDERRVRELIAHYEGQSEEEAVAEDEAAFERQSTSMVEVPNELLPAVRELLSKR